MLNSVAGFWFLDILAFVGLSIYSTASNYGSRKPEASEKKPGRDILKHEARNNKPYQQAIGQTRKTVNAIQA